MKKPQPLIATIVVAHLIVAISHLFFAAEILPAPNNNVSGMAVVLITSGHIAVLVALWKLSQRLSGLVSLVFFLAALGADLYEHFLHASANNIFMVATRNWTDAFDASVLALLALEILGCTLGALSLSGRPHPSAA